MSFRVNSGNGVGVVVSAGWTRLELRNEYHFSKENVFATHSSDIVPKGSPLKVRKLKTIPSWMMSG